MWTPPAPPNLVEILQSAVADTRAGAHAQALDKFVWFHHNAIRINPAMAGVRLSFALQYWWNLSQVYPPALDALQKLRDNAETACRDDRSNREIFLDLSSLNELLGDSVRTANTFETIAAADPEAAKAVYDIVERALIAAGRYEACSPFLDPPARVSVAAANYRGLVEFAASQPGSDLAAATRFGFTFDVATVIALLVRLGRTEEAAQAKAEGLEVLNDEEFRAELESAMAGEFPELPSD